MKNTKEKLFCLVLILSLVIILQGVSAYDTTVNVKLLKEHNFSILFNVNDPIEIKTIKSVEEYSNFQDTLTFTFQCDQSKISFHILALLGGRIVKSQKFEGYASGGVINLNLFEVPVPASSGITGSVVNNLNDTEPINNSNTSAVNNSLNTPLLNQTSAKNESFSGIKINWEKTFSWAGYIVGGIIILIGLFFGIKFIIQLIRRRTSSSRDDVYVNKDSKRRNTAIERELTEAEKKIKEVQEKIDSIKNRKKQIADAEARYEASKRELEKLKGY